MNILPRKTCSYNNTVAHIYNVHTVYTSIYSTVCSKHPWSMYTTHFVYEKPLNLHVHCMRLTVMFGKIFIHLKCSLSCTYVQYIWEILGNPTFKVRITKLAVKYCIIFKPFTLSYNWSLVCNKCTSQSIKVWGSENLQVSSALFWEFQYTYIYMDRWSNFTNRISPSTKYLYTEHHSVCPLVTRTEFPPPQSTYIQSTTVYVPSLELGLPRPFSRKRVCPPPRTKGWGGTLACG